VVLVDPSSDNHGIGHVSEFLKYDFTDHTKDETHARSIVQLLGPSTESINGCLTISESCLTLTTLICEELNLPNIGSKAARVVISKTLTLESLAEMEESRPFASKCCRICSEDDLAEAAAEVGFPAILKPDTGSDSFGVKYVTNMDDLKREYKTLLDKYDIYQLNNGFCDTMTLTEYLDGPSHKIDVVMFEGELLHAFVSDMAPSVTGRFVTSAFCVPSNTSCDRIKQIIDASYKCCLGVGLLSGVFHMEIKMTDSGPKMVEINGFIGSLTQQGMNKTCFGVDTLHCYAMTSCGIKPEFLQIAPACHIVGAKCYPTFHRSALNDEMNQRKIATLCDDRIVATKLCKKIPSFDDEYEKSCFSLTVYDSSYQAAKQRLIYLFEDLKLNSPSYNIKELMDQM